MKVARQFATHTLKRGRYWICDPGYAVPDEEWSAVVAQFDAPSGPLRVGDDEFFAWSTAYGDGFYPVTGPKCGDVAVDSGTLSVIPVALVRKWGTEAQMKDYEKRRLAMTVWIPQACEIKATNGDAEFGEYLVDTSGVLDDADDE